jgi:hypothetical protein
MLLGVLAGVLCFGFLKLVGEPPVERAIAFETQREKTEAPAHAHAAPGTPKEEPPELVSRATQAGLGLFVGVVVYDAAFGGLFALAFALAYGRIGDLSPRATAAVLAAGAFVAAYLMPLLKYPPNPPSVGEAETIGMRTGLYFSMIALSLAAMVSAGMLRRRLYPRLGGWNAALAAGAAYLIAMVVIVLALPAVNEVPEHFPAAILWDFRIAALGAQFLLCAALGIGIGLAAERVLQSAGASFSAVSPASRRAAP